MRIFVLLAIVVLVAANPNRHPRRDEKKPPPPPTGVKDVCNAETNNKFKEMQEEQGGGVDSKETVQSLQDFRGGVDLDLLRNDPDKFKNDYLVGLIGFGLPGFLMGGLCLLCCFCWFLCRMVCNRCCGGKTPKKEYSFKHKLVLYIIFGAAGVAVCACAGVGIASAGEFGTGLVGTLCAARKLVVHSSEFTTGLITPVQLAVNETFSIFTDLHAIVDGQDAIREDLGDVITELGEMEDDINHYDPSLPACICCEEWVLKTQITKQVWTEFGAFVRKQDDDLVAVNDFLDNEAFIGPPLEMASDILGSLNDYLADDLVPMVDDSVQNIGGPIQSGAVGAGFAMFGLSFATFFFMGAGIFIAMFLGMCSWLKCCACMVRFIVHIAWMLAAIVMILSFILNGVLLPVVVVVSDVCVIVDDFRHDVNAYAPLPEMAGDAMQACFDDYSVLVALDLETATTMTMDMEFASVDMDQPDMGQTSNPAWDGVDGVYAKIAAATHSDCFVGLDGFGQDLFTTWIEGLRSASNGIYDGMVDVENGSGDLTDKLADSLNIAEPMINATNDVMNHLDCGFVGKDFAELYESFCGVALGAALNVSVMLFVVAALNIPMIILAIILAKRIQKPKGGVAPEQGIAMGAGYKSAPQTTIVVVRR